MGILGKLANRRNIFDFEFYSSFVKDYCKDNQLILGELEHMKGNIKNPIEYYTALELIENEI